jgi:Dyp-type peroxidase family
MTEHLPNLNDIQANILRGSKRWCHACYVFLKITDRRSAACFVDALRKNEFLGVAATQHLAQANANINVAFTHRGLQLMNVTIDDTARFRGRHTLRSFQESADNEIDLRSAFEGGMYSAKKMDIWPVYRGSRYEWRQDGSVATAWWSDNPEVPWAPTTQWPHILVWISATDKVVSSAVYTCLKRLIDEHDGVSEIGCQQAGVLADRKEHFGFVDGISQPAIEGDIRPGNPGDGKLGARGWEGLKVGEFIVGYADESHQPTDEPFVNELAKDGTFLVYRKLRQDVAAFRGAASVMVSGAVDEDERAMMARRYERAMMGRKHNGNPLMVPPGAPEVPDDQALRNDFTYAGDRRGLRCPLGSHVRRSNPRDDLHFEGRRVNGHRIIRRGMPYGMPYDEDPESDDRGLIFIALNARIEDQFEFIQKQWLNKGTTFRIGDDADPIAGVGSDIRIVINGEQPVLGKVGLPFTQFLGGEYFFVPSIPALEQIALRAKRPVSDATPSE